MKGKGGKRIVEQTGEAKVKEVSNVPSLLYMVKKGSPKTGEKRFHITD